MSNIKFSPCDIPMPETLIDVLNGKSGILVDNIIPTDNMFDKRIISKKGSTFGPKLIGSANIALQAPYVYFKIADNKTKFTANYEMELTNERAVKQSFYIRKPVMESLNIISNKKKLSLRLVNDSSSEKPEAIAMVRIDNAICMANEYLLLATVAKYDYSKCSDDAELVNGLFTHLFKDVAPKILDQLASRYYKLIKEPPVWKSMDGSKGSMEIVVQDEDESEQISLLRLMSFINTNREFKSLQPIIKTVYKQCYEFLAPNKSYIVPMFRYLQFTIPNKETGSEDVKTITDAKLQFYIMFDPTPENINMKLYNANLPKQLYCTKCVSTKKSIPISFADFQGLYGGDDNESSGQMQNGFIWCRNQVELILYATTQAHTTWNCSKYYLHKNARTSSEDIGLGSEYIMDDDVEYDIGGASGERNYTSKPSDTDKLIEEFE